MPLILLEWLIDQSCRMGCIFETKIKSLTNSILCLETKRFSSQGTLCLDFDVRVCGFPSKSSYSAVSECRWCASNERIPCLDDGGTLHHLCLSLEIAFLEPPATFGVRYLPGSDCCLLCTCKSSVFVVFLRFLVTFFFVLWSGGWINTMLSSVEWEGTVYYWAALVQERWMWGLLVGEARLIRFRMHMYKIRWVSNSAVFFTVSKGGKEGWMGWDGIYPLLTRITWPSATICTVIVLVAGDCVALVG